MVEIKSKEKEHSNKIVPMRFMNVPMNLFRDSLTISSITTLINKVKEVDILATEEALLANSDMILRLNTNILNVLNGKHVRIYGPKDVGFEGLGEFVEYIGKMTIDEYPDILEVKFKGICIHRLAMTSEIVYMDFCDIKTSLANHRPFLYKTLEFIEEDEFFNIINNLIL